MKVIVTRDREDGSFDEVGMSNRTIIDLKTVRGIMKRLEKTGWADSRNRVRMEFYPGDNIHRDPARVEIHRPWWTARNANGDTLARRG